MRMRSGWLTEQEKALIYERAVFTLQRVGMRMAGTKHLQLLAAAGAEVDEPTAIVRFPPEMVQRAVKLTPRRLLMAGATPPADVVLDEGAGPHFSSSGCVAKTLDYRTGKRRPSVLQDLREGTAVYDETPEVDVVWTFATANDVPVERRELVEYHTFLTHTAKPLVMVDCPSHIEAVKAIFEVLAGSLAAYRERPRMSALCAAFSPLAVDGRLLDHVIELAGCGAPLWLYSMPISGATAPVTIAGTLALVWAEILGMVTVVQHVHPGSGIIACCGPGILDMRTTNMSLGCLENTLVGIGGTEVGHWLGLPVHNAGFSSDAKHAGIQAGYEKALKGFAAASAGADILSGGIGLIDSSNTWYMPLIPIEAEIIAMIERMLGEVEVSQSTLLGEMVERVGIGGNFLGETETRRRVRADEHFMPWIAARTSYDTWKTAGRTEIDVGRERAEQLLVRHAEREPSLTEDQQRELASICGVVPGRTR